MALVISGVTVPQVPGNIKYQGIDIEKVEVKSSPTSAAVTVWDVNNPVT